MRWPGRSPQFAVASPSDQLRLRPALSTACAGAASGTHRSARCPSDRSRSRRRRCGSRRADFVGECARRPLHQRVVADRLVEVGAREPDDVDRDRPSYSRGNELGAEAACDDRPPRATARHRRIDGERWNRTAAERRARTPIGRRERATVVSRTFRAEKRLHEHRHQRQREHQRASSAKITVSAIGRNSFPSTPSSSQDREEDDHDDQLAEHRRLAHLDRRIADDVEAAPCQPCLVVVRDARTLFSTMMTELSTTSRSRSRRGSEGSRDPELHHAGEREEHRQRNRQPRR
jgi:hypothetical protein